MTNPHLNQERAELLTNRAKGAPVERLPQWPRTDKMLPVVELEVDWVRFSMLNHRTKAERLKVSRDRGNPHLFDQDPLGPTAQEAQFQLLREQPGFEDLKSDLKDRGQREVAVVTIEGVLINGNRRVAALRDLYNKDHHLDSRYVRAFVLPADATPGEIRLLEAELQVSKTFLEDYSWINRGFLLEELLTEHDQDFDMVAKLMRMKPKEVRAESKKFKQVDQLVAMSGQAYMHVDFEPNETAFKELSEHIASKAAAEANAVRYTVFLGTLAGCRYRDLRHLLRADALEYVVPELEENPVLKVALRMVKASPASVGDAGLDALLGDALGPDAGGSKVEDLLGFLATSRREATVTLDGVGTVTVEALLQQVNVAVTDAAQDARDDDEELRTVQGPIRYVSDAYEKACRAREVLAQARALPDWVEGNFTSVLAQLREAVAALEKM